MISNRKQFIIWAKKKINNFCCSRFSIWNVYVYAARQPFIPMCYSDGLKKILWDL